MSIRFQLCTLSTLFCLPLPWLYYSTAFLICQQLFWYFVYMHKTITLFLLRLVQLIQKYNIILLYRQEKANCSLECAVGEYPKSWIGRIQAARWASPVEVLSATGGRPPYIGKQFLQRLVCADARAACILILVVRIVFLVLWPEEAALLVADLVDE